MPPSIRVTVTTSVNSRPSTTTFSAWSETTGEERQRARATVRCEQQRPLVLVDERQRHDSPHVCERHLLVAADRRDVHELERSLGQLRHGSRICACRRSYVRFTSA